MATQHFFNGKIIKLPGAYSAVKYVTSNIPTEASYSKVLLIDTGIGAECSGGSGVVGEFNQDKNSIYRFKKVSEFQNFIKCGYLYKIAEALFNPTRVVNATGISELIYISAKTSTAASKAIVITDTGAFTIKSKDEGVFANGVKETIDTVDFLTRGYALTLHTGVRDVTKFIVKIWVSTYTGVYTDGIAYDEVSKENAFQEIVWQSPEITTITELVDSMNTDPVFQAGFSVTLTKTGTFATADLTLLPGLQLFAGGTESYDSDDLNAALEAVKDLDYSIILATEYGDAIESVNNTRLQFHVQSEAKFEKFLAVAGHDTKANLQDDKDAAVYYNSDRVWIIPGGCGKLSPSTVSGYREWDALYTAALVVGRIAGLQPQVPGTFKSVSMDKSILNLNEGEKEDCLDAGLLVVSYDEDFQQFTILKSVNSLQNNKYLANPDGTSASIQLKRIASQLNKELVINAKRDLLSQESGVNRNTLSPSDLKDYTEVYLQSRIATLQRDNLIISFQDVAVDRVGDAYNVTYRFEGNTEISFLFFTGFQLI